MSEQSQWHFCQNCSCMFFGGNAVNAGACVGGSPRGGLHIAEGFEFTLPFAGAEAPNAQKDWFFCRKCACMFFGGNPGTCVKGGGHDGTGSFNFHLPHDIPEAPSNQKGWRFCRKCSVMFFGGNPGKCVKGGGHDGTGSFNFVLRHGTTFIPHSVFFDDGTN